MRKQTKLVAVLSTAALLAIGASMTSFAATGWAEEDGTWVYYNRDGERATESWKKSGNSWYWLDENGEMAIDQLIEDVGNYYYVDINGVMASNQWVAIDNEDAGEDDEPDHYWYYFQANGKALKNGDNSKVALKTVNGKKYAFDEEGKMLFGWVNEDNAERIDNTDGDAFKEGTYYFGDSDDGAMTTGWLLMDITYDEATADSYKEIAPVFNDDEDQSRWFYFKSNGKKLAAENGNQEKEKTINGKKYAFDEYGAMIAEWSADVDAISDYYAKASANQYDSKGGTVYTLASYSADGYASPSSATSNGVSAKYAQEWRYFQDVENGARVSKGWFKVVAAEYLNYDKYNDDEDAWYYADGNGKLYAGEFKTIKGKKYAFRDDGRMINGLKFIKDNGTGLSVIADDDENGHDFDTEDGFDAHAPEMEVMGYSCYYFGGGDDGAMKTGKNTITIDGENFSFYFEKSGSKKGQDTNATSETYNQYSKLDDAQAFIGVMRNANKLTEGVNAANVAKLQELGVNKKVDDLAELYLFDNVDSESYFLVNTSGKVIDTNSKSKDGNDYVYVVKKNGAKPGKIVAIYVED